MEDRSTRRVSVLQMDTKDNNILISGDNKGIKFWNLKKKQAVRKLKPDAHAEFKNIVISDDHRYLIASGGNAYIWDLSNGEQIDILSGGGTDQAEDIIFLPQSHQFITIGGGSVGMPHMHLWKIKLLD
jgi:WD40 repeat protein